MNIEIKPPTNQRLAGYVILIVEDDKINQCLLEHMLSAEGAACTSASYGDDGIRQLQNNKAEKWSAVLTDIEMPIMNGHQLAQRIQVFAPQLPIIGITAHDDEAERRRCLDSGMVECLSKPVNRTKLVEAVLRFGISNASPLAPDLPSENPNCHAVEAININLASHVNDAEMIPWATLVSTFGNRLPFVVQLAQKALTAHMDMVSNLSKAVARQDLQQIAFLAHGIKGMAGNFQSLSFKELASELEMAARTNAVHAIPTLAAQVLALESQFLEEISQFCAAQR